MLFCIFPVCYDVRLSHLNKDYLLTYLLTIIRRDFRSSRVCRMCGVYTKHRVDSKSCRLYWAYLCSERKTWLQLSQISSRNASALPECKLYCFTLLIFIACQYVARNCYIISVPRCVRGMLLLCRNCCTYRQTVKPSVRPNILAFWAKPTLQNSYVVGRWRGDGWLKKKASCRKQIARQHSWSTV